MDQDYPISARDLVATEADDCFCSAEKSSAPDRRQPRRPELIRRAFWLEFATVGWMVIEAGVTIWSGVQAHSMSLLAFGIDSVIELASAGVVIWRLIVELRRGQSIAEGAERVASRIAGVLLLALATYIVVAAGWKLLMHTGEEFSWPGLIVTLLAIPICLYALPRGKIAVANALGSRAIRADAVESLTCGWLSLVVVVGLVIEALTGAWWVDAATSLGIVWFLVKEGRLALRGEGCGCC